VPLDNGVFLYFIRTYLFLSPVAAPLPLFGRGTLYPFPNPLPFRFVFPQSHLSVKFTVLRPSGPLIFWRDREPLVRILFPMEFGTPGTPRGFLVRLRGNPFLTIFL